MVPPAASLTFVWGQGGCTLDFEGGSFKMGPGDWMWIDSGFAHRGENAPGSDFLTVFIADQAVENAGLNLAPIGAATEPAPPELAGMLTALAALLLEGAPALSFERPALDALLDWIGTVFEPMELRAEDHAVRLARSVLKADPLSPTPIAEVAANVGLSGSELSRRFSRRYRLSPIAYRKQLRLVLATRELVQGRSISDAAHAAGFSDTPHLSRTFKDQYGVTPSAWLASVYRR